MKPILLAAALVIAATAAWPWSRPPSFSGGYAGSAVAMNASTVAAA